jgi:hypothetical protein
MSLFADVIMPGGMSGRELADKVLKLRPIKVLYTSGYTDHAIVHQGRLDPGVLPRRSHIENRIGQHDPPRADGMSGHRARPHVQRRLSAGFGVKPWM